MASRCWCWVNPKKETFHHFFFRSYATNKIWSYFLSSAGIAMDGLSLHQAIIKCWTAKVVARLQLILQALPSIIVWELWKRRNGYKYREPVKISRVIYQVSTTLQSLMKVRKPSFQNVPHKWPDLLHIFEHYTPTLKVSKVIW